MANAEYEIQADYGYGWEKVVSEYSKEDAEARLKEYNENERRIPHRLVVVEAEDGNSSGCQV